MNLVLVTALGIAGSPSAQAAMNGTPQFPTMRVAVVNIAYVFNKYERAQAFKENLETTLDPYKAKAAMLNKRMQGWQAAIDSKDFRAASKEDYEEKIVLAKRDLEDMSRELNKLLGKKQEENLVILWKEVNAGIRAYAKTHKIDIVLSYGDPLEKDLLDRFPNVNRKMQAMDTGSSVPLFLSERADISVPVTQMLNRWARDSKKPKTAPADVD
jgi:Skp family chaperone for outer membrane proteins